MQRTGLDYANELSALKFFPSNPHGVLVIANIIDELCGADSEAEWLVREILERFDEWPGPATLRTVYLARFPPDFDQGFKPEGPPPPVNCSACNDWGTVEQNGSTVRCECPAGQTITDEILAIYVTERGRALASLLRGPDRERCKRVDEYLGGV